MKIDLSSIVGRTLIEIQTACFIEDESRIIQFCDRILFILLGQFQRDIPELIYKGIDFGFSTASGIDRPWSVIQIKRIGRANFPDPPFPVGRQESVNTQCAVGIHLESSYRSTIFCHDRIIHARQIFLIGIAIFIISRDPIRIMKLRPVHIIRTGFLILRFGIFIPAGIELCSCCKTAALMIFIHLANQQIASAELE